MRSVLAAVVLAVVCTSAALAEEARKIKVVILAGQSNMEGKAKVSLLEYQAAQPATAKQFAHWRADDRWRERDDVHIKFFDRQGKLTVGYGSPQCIGPELEIGTVLGEHFSEPVLLIKTAWGGRSLYRDFRPPSAGLPPAAVLEKLLAEQQKRNPQATLDDVKQTFGASYRAMLEEVRETLRDLPKVLPNVDAKDDYELIGFVWFQGWNDMIDAQATAAYTDNLRHFIHDVRRDLKAPQLPFVIGEMGVDGLKPGENVGKFKAAQAAVLEDKTLAGNVAVVKTDLFWDTEAEAVFKKGWRENIDEWNKVGSDYPYHYLGSPKTMFKIGRALGEVLVQLQPADSP